MPLRSRPRQRADLRAWLQPLETGPFRFGAAPTDALRMPSPDRFGQWMAAARPEFRWDYRHFLKMQDMLDRVTAGQLRRAFFQLPIRHGKTEHNSEGYPAYRIEKNATTRVLMCSYNQNQAQKMSRAIRRVCKARGVAISTDRDTAGEWETTAGGGVRAVGAGSGVASVNADLIVVDDPIGSRDEAESPAGRDRVWDWFTNDLLARCEPHTAVLFTMSRWHTDDPAGRLRDQQGDRWEVLDLPGRAEPNDPLGRAENEPLWPELRDANWLDEKRAELGEYGFASLIQGRPRPREGGMFKWSWWQLMDEIPAQGQMIRYWDLAGTQPRGGSHDPDYSAGVLACRMLDKRTAIIDVARERLGIAARDAWLETICLQDLHRFRGRIRWWIETEAGIAGTERTQALVRRLQALGMPVSTEHPTGNKVHRAEPLASKVEAGNVVLCPDTPAHRWREPLRAEGADFPNGRHDDQIDAAAGADAKLTVLHTSSITSLYI